MQRVNSIEDIDCEKEITLTWENLSLNVDLNQSMMGDFLGDIPILNNLAKKPEMK
jgi:hypothetical protein